MSAWEAMCLSSGPKRDLQARMESHSSPLGAGRELEEEKGEAITRGKEKRNPSKFQLYTGDSSQPTAAVFSPPATQRLTGPDAWKEKEVKDNPLGKQVSHLWLSTTKASQGCLRPRPPSSASWGQQIGYNICRSKTEL